LVSTFTVTAAAGVVVAESFTAMGGTLPLLPTTVSRATVLVSDPAPFVTTTS